MMLVQMVKPDEVAKVVKPVRDAWEARGFKGEWQYVVEEDEFGIPGIYTTVIVDPDITVEEVMGIEDDVQCALRASDITMAYFPYVNFSSNDPEEDRE